MGTVVNIVCLILLVISVGCCVSMTRSAKEADKREEELFREYLKSKEIKKDKTEEE